MPPIAFRAHEAVVVGQPMPFSVYGSDRKLLLAKGLPITSERMRGVILSQAAFITSPEKDTGAAELRAADVLPISASTTPGGGRALSNLPENIVEQPITGALAELCRRYSNVNERARFGLRIARDERAESYQTQVISIIHDKRYIMLSAPVNSNGVLIPINKDEVWMCRLFNAATVFRFKGRVLKVAFEPLPYIHIELPKSVERRMVRRRPRALSVLGAALHQPDGDRIVIVDLSVTGARLAVDANTPLQKDSVLTLYTNISMLDRVFQLQLNARITTTFGANDKHFPNIHFYGVEFDAPDETALVILHGYVQEQLAVELDRLSRILPIEAAYEASSESWLSKK